MNLEDKLPEYVDQKYENRKNQEQNFTGEKLSHLERQKQVYLMHLQGYKNQEISNVLHVSISTVEKDLHEIREEAKSWFMEISKSGMAKSLIDSFLQIDEAQKELWKIYRASSVNSNKIKILNSITDMALKKKAIFWGTKQDPYYHGYGKSDLL